MKKTILFIAFGLLTTICSLNNAKVEKINHFIDDDAYVLKDEKTFKIKNKD